MNCWAWNVGQAERAQHQGRDQRLPDELEGLVLCNVQLVRDKAEEAWVSEGPIGIGTVLKDPLFREVKGRWSCSASAVATA